jgi:hypothetical protein
MQLATAYVAADINKDLSASVDYDVNGKGANIRAGYKNGDVTLALRTAVDTQSKKMAHTGGVCISQIQLTHSLKPPADNP